MTLRSQILMELTKFNLSSVRGLTGYESTSNAKAWSIDNRILIQAQEPSWSSSTDYDIYWISHDGAESGSILNESSNSGLPGWSPDGQKIVFFSNRGGNEDLWVMDRDGNNLHQLTDDTYRDYFPHWGKVMIK